MIVHHPGRDMLLAYAAGQVPEAVSLITATHLALCPQCRDIVHLGETIGGLIMENLPPTPIPPAVIHKLRVQLNGAPSAYPCPGGKRDLPTAVPEPLLSYLDGDLDQIRWIPIAPGLAYRPIMTGSCSARLLRSRPRQGIGMHTHKGQEFSLVIAGGYTDSSGHYVRGDFQAADRRLAHRPVADDGGDCVILIVNDAPLVFSNSMVGLIAKLIGC